LGRFRVRAAPTGGDGWIPRGQPKIGDAASCGSSGAAERARDRGYFFALRVSVPQFVVFGIGPPPMTGRQSKLGLKHGDHVDRIACAQLYLGVAEIEEKNPVIPAPYLNGHLDPQSSIG